MARSPRTAVAPPPAASSTPAASTISTRPSRRRQSVSTSTAPSTPFTPGPVTPSESSTPFSGFTSATAGPSRAAGGLRGHALRSVGTAADRTPCPFPSEYGGREKCGVNEEDEVDEVLMAACGALAMLNNKALSPEELARISVDNGWIRPPTAAVEPTAPFNASIRNHFKRCEKSIPPRQPLLSKYQLVGSVAEQICQPALHPDAFSGGARPKGTVYYLSACGKAKWKNPFVGIEIPKPPAKKPGPVKKYPKDKEKRAKDKEGVKGKTKQGSAEVAAGQGQVQGGTSAPPPVKLRLFLNPGGAAAKEKEREREMREREQGQARASGELEDTEMGVASMTTSAGPSVPVSRESSGRSSPLPVPPSTSFPPRRSARRPSRLYDSTDDSETSDSEEEAGTAASNTSTRFPRLNRPIRRSAPAPIAISGSPRFSHLSRLPQGSPFKELFFPSATHAATFPFCPPSPHPAPFPTHSLDNTLWTVRAGEQDRYGFESSSSSSDDEMRDPDWGQTSGILIRADDEEVPVWAAGTEDEAKIKEATDALRVLFPMVNSEERMEVADPRLEFNQLDNNRPLPSDTSSIAESTSTAAPARPFRSMDGVAHIPLNTWVPTSSPVPSPVMRVSVLIPVDTSPTQHLSRLSTSLEEGMDIDEDQSWLDEAGEGPVRADPDETLSDSEVVSQLGDVASPEHDRRRHTAEWAREAAVSTAFRVKEELVDYPSPGLTECDEDPDSLSPHDISRASSADTQAPSSGGSDVLLDDGDEYDDPCGPESMTVEDVDGLYNPLCPVERTPQRGKKSRGRAQPSGPQHRRTSSSGKIGVAALLQCTPRNPSPAKTTRSLRPSTRRRKSSPGPIPLDHPPTPPLTDVPLEGSPPRTVGYEHQWEEAIGTAELERAMAEAEAREEEHRVACRERAEQKRALLEAYRQRIGSSPDNRSHMPLSTSFSDLTSSSAAATPSAAWGSASSDSLYMANASGAMSPMALHSMSMLSLRDMPSSVDPRALRSPPIAGMGMAGMGMGIGVGMEDVMGMQGVMGVQQQTQGDVVMDGSTAEVTPPVTGVIAPIPTNATKQVQPRPAASTAAPPPHTAPSATPSAPPSTQSRPASTAPSLAVTAPASRVTTPTPATAPARPAARPDNHGHHIAVPLCNGVRISVISMIPVYFLNHTSKLGTFVVIRRIDSDFVNATTLLLALGIPKGKHHTIVNPTGNNPFPSCKEVYEPQDTEMGYDAGVVGLWIRLHDARFLRDRFKGQGYAENPIWALLNDDIVEKFVAIIKNQDISHIHTNKEHFGSPFHATPRNPTLTAASSSTSTPTSTPSSAPGGAGRPRPAPVPIAARKPGSGPAPNPNAGPAHPRANSAAATSGPARPLAAASAPAVPVQTQGQGPKGALIRPANTNPDECPQAKRRRATVVGTTAPKPMLAAKPPTTAPVPIASKIATMSTATNKPPPSMVQPGRPAAPAVTVTPISATQGQAQGSGQAQGQMKRVGMVPASAPGPVAGAGGGNKVTANTVGGQKAAAPAGRPTSQTSTATVQLPTAQPRPIAGPTASTTGNPPVLSASVPARRTTRASVGGETVKG